MLGIHDKLDAWSPSYWIGKLFCPKKLNVDLFELY